MGNIVAGLGLDKVGRCRLTLSNHVNAPITKRSKLKYNKLLSSFAFKFSLRHYNKEFRGKVGRCDSKLLMTFNYKPKFETML